MSGKAFANVLPKEHKVKPLKWSVCLVTLVASYRRTFQCLYIISLYTCTTFSLSVCIVDGCLAVSHSYTLRIILR